MQHDDTLAWWREPTRGQWASFGAAWIGWVLDAFDFTVFLLVMPLIAEGVRRQLHRRPPCSITLTLLRASCSAAPSPALRPRIAGGRKLPLMISLVWFAICDRASSASRRRSPGILDPPDDLPGASGWAPGVGPAGATLAMENWPARRPRHRLGQSFRRAGPIGYLLAAGAAAVVVPQGFGSWRALFIARRGCRRSSPFPIRAVGAGQSAGGSANPRRGAGDDVRARCSSRKTTKRPSPGRRSRWRRALAATTRSPVSTRRSSSKSTAST